jgi:hypothetical protein
MTAAHMGGPVMAACCLGFAAGAPAMAQPLDPIRADNWHYYPEYPISCDDVSHKWFVPIDLMPIRSRSTSDTV